MIANNSDSARWSTSALVRQAPRLFCAFAVALIPWIIYLRLAPAPSGHHTNLFWVIYDLGLMAALGSTAWLMHRHRREAPLAALLTAGLLIFDAWLDIAWAATVHQLIAALARAAFIEMPIAVFSLYLLLHMIRVQIAATYRASRPRTTVSRRRTRPPAALHPRSQTP